MRRARGLTARQAQIVAFIRSFTEAHGRSPSYREIAVEIGVRSTNAVSCHLDAIERKGWIRRGGFSSRNIVVVKGDDDTKGSEGK